MDSLRARLDACCNQILQDQGCGEELNEVSCINSRILTVVRALEEQLCEAMVDE